MVFVLLFDYNVFSKFENVIINYHHRPFITSAVNRNGFSRIIFIRKTWRFYTTNRVKNVLEHKQRSGTRVCVSRVGINYLKFSLCCLCVIYFHNYSVVKMVIIREQI